MWRKRLTRVEKNGAKDMSKLKIEYVPIESIKPYKFNAKKHPKEQIEQIKASIRDFSMSDPVGVWHNEVVEGHGRLIACKELGFREIPIIRLDNLTDEQRRAYTLVHNKLTMNSGFDVNILNQELEEIESFDMDFYGFEIDIPNFEVDDREPSCQHNVFENQERMQFESDNYYGIPNMEATQITSDKMLRFCDYNDIQDHSEHMAHFYYDDFKFIQAWRNPDKYIDKLREFKAVISPDFSLYTDFPRALQILSCYRRQWVGAYWQYHGIDVIPDVVWGDETSFDYCFLGIPKHSTVAVSAVGVTNNEEWNDKQDSLFRRGYEEMLKRLEPTTILYYGSMIEGLEGNIIRIPSFYEQRREILNEKQ